MSKEEKTYYEEMKEFIRPRRKLEREKPLLAHFLYNLDNLCFQIKDIVKSHATPKKKSPEIYFDLRNDNTDTIPAQF